jgi:hypothetical protein
MNRAGTEYWLQRIITWANLSIRGVRVSAVSNGSAGVHLRLRCRRVGLRHESRFQRFSCFGGNLRPALRYVVAHRRVRQVISAELVDQPGQHPPGGMPLLLRRVQVRAQHAVDRRLKRRQLRGAADRCLARRRHRAGQRLSHRPAVHVIPIRQLPDRALFDPRVASDLGEQLHPRRQPPAPSVITSQFG